MCASTHQRLYRVDFDLLATVRAQMESSWGIA
jgi:hypothetical protein